MPARGCGYAMSQFVAQALLPVLVPARSCEERPDGRGRSFFSGRSLFHAAASGIRNLDGPGGRLGRSFRAT